MKFNAVTPKLVDGLSAIVGAEHMLLPAAGKEMRHYTHDVTEDLLANRMWFLNLLTPPG